MKFRLYVPLFCAVVMMGVMSSCSDDDEPSFEIPTIPGEVPVHAGFEGKYTLGKTVSVTSEASHQSGQKHRSSNNFSTKALKDDNMRYMIVSCPDGVTFNINVDKTGTDEEWTYDVYNGAILEYRNSDKLYIADPSGAGSSFTVKFTSLDTVDEDATFVSSPGRVRAGQNHRASVNFTLNNYHVRFRVNVSDKKARFSINTDYDVISDATYVKNLGDGHMYNRPVRESAQYDDAVPLMLYLADPKDAEGPFQVLFEPYVPEWMTPLDDNLSIADISIPGTHDTGTYELEPVNFGFSKCQNMTIREQLDFGIRYLDLRVDGMDLTHGGLPCNLSLKTVINNTVDFLKEHPGEFVIYEMTDEGGYMPNKFIEYIEEQKLTDYFYMQRTVPKVRDVRGKIVVVRRFKLVGELAGQEDKWGLDFSNGWPEDTAGSYTTDTGMSFFIQDRFYKGINIEHSTSKKAELINQAIDSAMVRNDIVINFSSISASVTHTPYMFMWGGTGVNPRICTGLKDRLKELNQEGKTRAGWIIMDYPACNGNDDYAHIVERIINTNYDTAHQPFPEGSLHYEGE